MSYSTLLELQNNLPYVVDASYLDATLTGNIETADKVVIDDLSKVVDWTEVDALTYVPRIINRLSQYQSCVVTIERNWQNNVAIIGDGTEAENNAYDLWLGKYTDLLGKVKSGDVAILDDENNEISLDVARPTGPGRII